VALGLLLAVAAVAAVAFENAYAGRALPGVSIAGVDVTGLSPAEARDRIAAIATEPSALTVVIGSRTVTVPAAVFGRTADVDGAVAAAMAAGRGGGLLADAGDRLALLTGGRDISLSVSIDEARLERWLAVSAMLVGRRAVDAMVVTTPTGWEQRSDTFGVGLDETASGDMIRAALLGGQPLAGPLTLPIRPLAPVVDDLDVSIAIGKANRMAADVKLALGDEDWTLAGAKVRTAIGFAVQGGELVPVVDAEALQKALAAIAKDVKVAPVQTIFLTTKYGSVFGHVPGRAGRNLDTATTATRIVEQLYARRDGGSGSNMPVTVATVAVQPKISAEEAAKIAPRMTRISGWTTRFVVSEKNGFGNNIILPARYINGTVVRPGEVFDFWRAVGPITPARGFRMGGIIQGGHTVPTGAIGGGICSASTTMFNAAARGGYQILERHAHYYYITRYPLGLDATVSKSGGVSTENMRFRNDTGSSLFIRGLAGGGWVRFEIYSLPTGRSVSFTRPSVSNVRPAVDKIVKTSSLRRGRTDRQEYPANGMNVVVSRIVRDARGKVIHRNTWVSHYGRVDGILLVGTG
jgi:vancomycin resistance protein YoaR